MHLNEQLFLAINHLAHKNTVLDAFMVFCAQYIPIILGFTLIGAWFWPRERRAAFRAAVSGAGALVLAPVVGLLYYQVRPFALGLGTKLIHHVTDNGIPSDHTAVSFGVAVSLLLSGSGLGPYAIALAVLVGFARIFVGVHFPSDVLAGATLGTLVALLIHWGRRWIDHVADYIHRVQTRVLRRG